MSDVPDRPLPAAIRHARRSTDHAQTVWTHSTESNDGLLGDAVSHILLCRVVLEILEWQDEHDCPMPHGLDVGHEAIAFALNGLDEAGAHC
jgi:hypothetical protein